MVWAPPLGASLQELLNRCGDMRRRDAATATATAVELRSVKMV